VRFELDTTFALPLLYVASASSNNVSFEGVDSVLSILNRRRGRLNAFERFWLEALIATDAMGTYESFRRAAEIAPGSKLVYNYGNAALVRLNRPQEALDAFMALDPERGAMRGWVPYWDKTTDALHRLGEHERELEMALRARELFPDVPRALALSGYAFAALARVEDALRVVDEIVALNTDPYGYRLLIGWELNRHVSPEAEAAQGVYERILAWYQRLPDDERDGNYGQALLYSGRLDEAEVFFRSTNDSLLLAIIAARRGDDEVARDQLRRLQGEGGRSLLSAVEIAALLGEPQTALEMLARFSREYEAPYIRTDGLHSDPHFDSLRDHPEFQEFMRPKG